MLILGLDPGLRNTGWGLVFSEGSRLKHVANGAVVTDNKADIATRLAQIHDGLQEVVREYQPKSAGVEETFSNTNAKSSLALGLARGVVILVPALFGIPVSNYPPNKIKKAVVGAGKADKQQVQMMVQHLLPGVDFKTHDAADALAVAICHAHLRVTEAKWMNQREKLYA